MPLLQMKNIIVDKNEIGSFTVIMASRKIFSRETILKVVYTFTDRYFIHITSDSENYSIFISHKETEQNYKKINTLISEALIEQEMRQIVIKETGAIRQTIMTKAFSEAAKGLKLTPNCIPKENHSYKDDPKSILSLKG